MSMDYENKRCLCRWASYLG